MNRIIKFRCWDEYSSKMIYIEDFESIIFNKDLDFANYKVMQFTGLVDSLGKDIYEGDIYSIRNGSYAIWFKNGAFCGGKNIDKCSPLSWDPELYENGKYSGDMQTSSFPSKVVVTGNIYQNKFYG